MATKVKQRSEQEVLGRCWLPVYVDGGCFYCNHKSPLHDESCKILHKENSVKFSGKDQMVFVPEGGL